MGTSQPMNQSINLHFPPPSPFPFSSLSPLLLPFLFHSLTFPPLSLSSFHFPPPSSCPPYSPTTIPPPLLHLFSSIAPSPLRPEWCLAEVGKVLGEVVPGLVDALSPPPLSLLHLIVHTLISSANLLRYIFPGVFTKRGRERKKTQFLNTWMDD